MSLVDDPFIHATATAAAILFWLALVVGVLYVAVWFFVALVEEGRPRLRSLGGWLRRRFSRGR